jgi:hypothetical protein
MTPADPKESTTADLINLIYAQQATLKLLVEALIHKHNPVSPRTWDYLSISQYYLNADLHSWMH